MAPRRASPRLHARRCDGDNPASKAADASLHTGGTKGDPSLPPPPPAKKLRNSSQQPVEETKTDSEDLASSSGETERSSANDDSQSRSTRCLGRPQESRLRRKDKNLRHVMGIDEAGRGPLAGPVVVAAAIVPTDLPGVIDSKQIKDEEDRERTYAVIMASPGVRWALAVVDAPTIDEINILQATLLGMRMAALALVSDDAAGHPIVSAPCVSIRGCYVVRGFTDHQGQQLIERSGDTSLIPEQVYALVDGNRLPQQMPCRAEPIVKGDSKEYSIAAASILAKVTRDRLMRGFSDLYPAYLLCQHKGYPTAAHVAAIRRHGACPIHRRTFAPIKHMDLDERGQLLGSKPCASDRDSSKKRRRRAAAATNNED